MHVKADVWGTMQMAHGLRLYKVLVEGRGAKQLQQAENRGSVTWTL